MAHCARKWPHSSLWEKLALGPTSWQSKLTSQPHPPPPRRRRCAQVRNVSIRVGATCEFPHLFFGAHVDQHPTHHPPPCRLASVDATNSTSHARVHVVRNVTVASPHPELGVLDRTARTDSVYDVDEAHRFDLSVGSFTRTHSGSCRARPRSLTPRLPRSLRRIRARRTCSSRHRRDRATVAIVSGRQAERLGSKHVFSLSSLRRVSLCLRRPVGARARTAGCRKACLWARYRSSKPGRANHRTPSRSLRKSQRVFWLGSQITSQKTGTISRVVPPL